VAAVPARATVPKPAFFEVVGAASFGGGAVEPRVDLFYQRLTNQSLVAKRAGRTEALGGILTSGVSAVAMADGEFVDEAVYVRGDDGAIWTRTFSDGLGEWSPWNTLGGVALGAPGVTTVGSPAEPVVYVTGLDQTLWRRTPLGWGSQGGVLFSDPAGLAPVGGSATPGEEAFALGQDIAVWEWSRSGGWHRIGGQSVWAPAATLLPDGSADLYVVGLDDALWVAHRGTTGDFGAFHRIGGVFTSALSAAVDMTAPASRNVYGLGTDGQIWRAKEVLGGAESWTLSQVP
jgi:hypothetical protein